MRLAPWTPVASPTPPFWPLATNYHLSHAAGRWVGVFLAVSCHRSPSTDHAVPKGSPTRSTAPSLSWVTDLLFPPLLLPPRPSAKSPWTHLPGRWPVSEGLLGLPWAQSPWTGIEPRSYHHQVSPQPRQPGRRVQCTLKPHGPRATVSEVSSVDRVCCVCLIHPGECPHLRGAGYSMCQGHGRSHGAP